MNYFELIAEAALRSGVPEVPARADYYISQAERWLEKKLRVADMETTVTLSTDSAGEADLPADFLQLRSVGDAAVYGNKLLTGISEGTVSITYYAKLPGLRRDAAGMTNWLLDSDPEIYLQAVLLQIYLSVSDAAKAQATVQVLETLLADLRREDVMKRYNGQRIDSRGMMG